MSAYALREMLLNSWHILGILLLMSVISLTIIMDRLAVFRRVHANAGAFMAALIRIIAEQGTAAAAARCRQSTKPVAMVAGRILSQTGGREALERAGRHALQAQINRLVSYLSVLGTTATLAPFIGLFGTVTGVIKAFHALSINAAAGPEVISAGIAEALITTAVGLMVAIPAVVFYNFFVRKTEVFTQEIDLAMFDLIEALAPDSK